MDHQVLPTERQTRQAQIDHLLLQAGWDVNKPDVVTELRLASSALLTRESTVTYRMGNEFVDYALLGRDGKPLAIVEAKRSSRDALAGKRQAADYADRIQAHYGVDPFIFLSNGEVIWF